MLISAQLVIVSCSLSQESELHHLGAVVFPGAGGQELIRRQERSLINTFPFTQAQDIQSSPRYGANGEKSRWLYLLSISREVKQAEDVRTDFDTVAASPRCIDKVFDDISATLYFESNKCKSGQWPVIPMISDWNGITCHVTTFFLNCFSVYLVSEFSAIFSSICLNK